MSLINKEEFTNIDMATAAAEGFRNGQSAQNDAMVVTDKMVSAACSVCIGFSGDHGEYNDYLSRDAARAVLEAALAATKAQS